MMGGRERPGGGIRRWGIDAQNQTKGRE